jgi:hypothetical protein
MSADNAAVVRELMIALDCEHAERWSATNTERLDIGMSAAMQVLHKHAVAVPDFQKDTWWADVRVLSETTRGRLGR